jgi:hypothetical protein
LLRRFNRRAKSEGCRGPVEVSVVRSPVPRDAFLAQPLRIWVDVGWKFPDEADMFLL